MYERLSMSEEDTYELGRALGIAAQPGVVIALTGDLGAGKTVFARGVAKGLGVTTRVQSPTFIIIQTHEGGRLPFWHGDLYRLGDDEELVYLGLDEFIEGGGVVVLEWADRFPDCLPVDRLEIEIVHLSPSHRQIKWHGTGPSHKRIAKVIFDG
jgi:tRNA threonylcarbamoyladenosine biosynthesis protein TsaE